MKSPLNKLFCLILFGFIFRSDFTYAQNYNPLQWITITKEDGLAGHDVQCMLEDHYGTLWFGTSSDFFGGGGISRYDGKSFNNFTKVNGLADDNVYSILEDRQGNLWFGTDNGINCYDGRSFTNFTTDNGLAGNIVHSILEDRQGNLWFGKVIEIRTPKNHSIRFSDKRNGVSRYDGKSFTNFTTINSLADNNVSSILEDHQGILWFGTNNGVSCYYGESFTNFTTANGLGGNVVYSILADRKDYLWFGTNSGISRYDGKTFSTFTETDGLAYHSVRAIMEDRQGYLWFGTMIGVSRYDGKTFITFTPTDGLAGNDVWAMVEDSHGNLWFGTDEGVSRYDGKTFTNLTKADGLAGNLVQAISEDHQNNLWFCTNGGICKYSFTNHTPAIAHINEISVGIFLIIIQFDGFSYNTSANELKFVYRFDNKTWSKPQKRNWLWKSNLLGAGEHTFRIRAYDQYKNFPPTIEKKFTITKLQWLQNIFLYFLVLLSLFFFASIKVRKTEKRRNALKRKFNPYIAGPPIIDSKMFYGREELINSIINAVSQNNMAIRAERRMGKTSILHQLEQRLKKPLLPVLINIQGIQEQEFFSRLMERIIRTCKKYFKNPIDLAFEKNSRQYDDIDFISDLDTITTHLKKTFSQDVLLVLLIDEIDELVGYNIQISKRFRAIFTEGKLPVRTVVAGTFFDQQKWDDKTSPWFNFFVIHRLESLTEVEARALITKPSKGIYSFSKEAIERILTLSDKQPYLIQTICHYAINKILAEKRRKVTAADIETVYHSYIEGKEKP